MLCERALVYCVEFLLDWLMVVRLAAGYFRYIFPSTFSKSSGSNVPVTYEPVKP